MKNVVTSDAKCVIVRLKILVSAALGLLLLSACAAGGGGGSPVDSASASYSSAIAMSSDGRTVWTVNPDADTVTPIDVATLRGGEPVAVGGEPWAVAVAPDGMVVVMNRRSGTLSLLRGGTSYAEIEIGPEPGGFALSPSGHTAYVSVSSSEELVEVDLVAEEVVARTPLLTDPWGVAVTNDGDGDDRDESVYVTHRRAVPMKSQPAVSDDMGLGVVSIVGPGGSVDELVIAPYLFGFANGLESVVLHDGLVFVPHLLNMPEPPHLLESTVSASLSTAREGETRDIMRRRVHLNGFGMGKIFNFPRAMAVHPSGRYAYIVMAGSDAVMVLDLEIPEGARYRGAIEVGASPRGIVLSEDGTRAYVMNYLSRDVSVVDLSDPAHGVEVARIATTHETLPPDILEGKILFNSGADKRMAREGYVSCESCHIDGGADGTVWATAEGHRQTQPLWELEGTAPFHFSATRDEVQDFEMDIEHLFEGSGLAPGAASPLLGAPNGGTSAELDALAAFVLRGIRVPNAPEGDAEAIARGRAVFEATGCHACHSGPKWTTSHLPGVPGSLGSSATVVSAVLHDVGTYDPEHDVFGEQGFDVPTLLGLHASSPYLHDGSARDLAAVVSNPDHAKAVLSESEIQDLVAFLQSIDSDTPIFEPPVY